VKLLQSREMLRRLGRLPKSPDTEPDRFMVERLSEITLLILLLHVIPVHVQGLVLTPPFPPCCCCTQFSKWPPGSLMLDFRASRARASLEIWPRTAAPICKTTKSCTENQKWGLLLWVAAPPLHLFFFLPPPLSFSMFSTHLRSYRLSQTLKFCLGS
jgi:hypothetical protein